MKFSEPEGLYRMDFVAGRIWRQLLGSLAPALHTAYNCLYLSVGGPDLIRWALWKDGLGIRKKRSQRATEMLSYWALTEDPDLFWATLQETLYRWLLGAESCPWPWASALQQQKTELCQQNMSLEEDPGFQKGTQSPWHLDGSLVKPWGKSPAKLGPRFLNFENCEIIGVWWFKPLSVGLFVIQLR